MMLKISIYPRFTSSVTYLGCLVSVCMVLQMEPSLLQAEIIPRSASLKYMFAPSQSTAISPGSSKPKATKTWRNRRYTNIKISLTGDKGIT